MRFNKIEDESERPRVDCNQRIRDRGIPVHYVSDEEAEERLPFDDRPAPVLANVRERMVTLIEARLVSNPRLPPHVSTRALATRLDSILFSRARSVDSYRDVTTLKSRCEKLLRFLLQRRLHRAIKEADSTETGRQMVLTNVLGGKAEYQEVERLLQKVRRLEGLASTAPLTEEQKLPQPARNLLYNVTLMQAFYHAETASLTHLPWESMIQECHSILESYSQWRQQHQSSCS